MRSLWRIAAAVVAAILASDCTTGADTPRDSSAIARARAQVFPASAQSPLALRLRAAARWVVLFHPDLANCRPREAAVLRVLRRVGEEFPELRIFVVLPEAGARTTALFGEPLVGERVVVSNETYVAEGALSPRPRIEIWAGDGRLLLLRSLPPVLDEAQFEQEVRWARAFTAPLPEEAPR